MRSWDERDSRALSPTTRGHGRAFVSGWACRSPRGAQGVDPPWARGSAEGTGEVGFEVPSILFGKAGDWKAADSFDALSSRINEPYAPLSVHFGLGFPHQPQV